MLDTRLDPRQTITACLDRWRCSIVGCDDAGLRDQVRDIEAVSRMLHAVMLEAVAELEGRNLAASTGFGTTKRLPEGVLHLSAAETSTRVTHATQLATRRTLSGEVLPPALPHAAAALAAGEIGFGQVRVITETMGAIPTSVSAERREAAEADLARYARSFNPASLGKIGRHLLAHLDQDGPPPREEPEGAVAAGELRLRERRDGRLGLEGFLEPEHSVAFRSLIEQFAAPRPAREGIPDPRTTPQRNADALLEICGLARAAQDCPTTAGSLSAGKPCAPVWGRRPSITGPTSAPRRPDGGPATRKSSPSSSVGNPNHSTSDGPCAPSRYPFAARSWPGTGDAPSPAATDPRHYARRTTVGTGPTVATRASTTASYCARRTTGMCMAPGGKSLSTLTASSSSSQQSSTPTAGHYTTHSVARNMIVGRDAFGDGDPADEPTPGVVVLW